MADNSLSYLKIIVLVQFFFALGITLLTYTLPADTLNYVTGFSEVGLSLDFETTTAQVQESLDQQTNIPVIELGALVFYSGNIILDLLLNFSFAIPQMFTLLLQGIMIIVGVDSQIALTVQLFISALVLTLYFIELIQLLTGVRSGRLI